MNDKISIKLNIYFQNNNIGSCVLNIFGDSFWFTEQRLNDQNKLFDSVKNAVGTWLLSRVPNWNYSYIQLTSWLYDYSNLRLKNGLFIHSLNNNAFSWVDKCWIVPDEDVEFEYWQQKICFRVTTYSELLQSYSQWVSNQEFAFTKPLKWSNVDKKYFSLVKSTNADKPIFWYSNGKELLLQKLATPDVLRLEKDILSRLAEDAILVPETTITTICPDSNSVESGLEVKQNAYITKKCLVTEKTALLSVFQINQRTPQEIIHFIKSSCQIDNCECKKFDRIINLCELHDLDTTNFGFLIDNDTAKVAVWSNPIRTADKFFETDVSKIDLGGLFD